MEQKAYLESPVGRLVILEKEGAISQIHIAARYDPPGVPKAESSSLLEAKKQLTEYFECRRTVFELPLAPEGTAFQRRVWENLLKIPYGDTWSYKQLAEAVGKPKACRAVGGANGKNPIMIVIPCHRVIAADGSIGGYSGGLSVKSLLLALENPPISQL